MKYLHTEAVKEDRKRGVLHETEHRRHNYKPLQPSYVVSRRFELACLEKIAFSL